MLNKSQVNKKQQNCVHVTKWKRLSFEGPHSLFISTDYVIPHLQILRYNWDRSSGLKIQKIVWSSFGI